MSNDRHRSPGVATLELETLGWNSFFQDEFLKFDSTKFQPARVMAQHRGFYELRTRDDAFLAALSGKLKFATTVQAELPAVGDWVVVNRAKNPADTTLIESILPRKTRVSRKSSSDDTAEQVLAANLDTIFIVQGLDFNYNVRRIERYLAMTYESGARPVIILNKADVCTDVQQKIVEAQAVAAGVPVHAVSSVNKQGYEQFIPYLSKGVTVGFLGSSGVGKSTIINNLLGENVQRTAEVRACDSQGRHTTTHREIFILPSGGLLLDTPGMRELQLYDAESGIKDTFSDIQVLAVECRFSNCRHESEPGCAIIKAAADGKIDAARFENFKKLNRELEILKEKKEIELRQKKKDADKLTKDPKQSETE